MIVVYSKQDPAGVNIANHLRESTVKMELFEVNSEIIYCDNEIKDLKSDYLIFASKHKSETGNACFTAHTPGNWGKAEMGGKDKELCWGSPSAMKTILMNIAHHVELPKLGWPVQMEISHHGPFTKTPCFFVEIGSSEKEWSNELAGKIVADAIIDHTFKPYKWPVAFGIGGGHYCPKLTKYEIAGATEANAYAFGHALPNYHVNNVDLETFRQGIERSSEKVEKILIDWKGLKKEQRGKILKFIEEIGVKWGRV